MRVREGANENVLGGGKERMSRVCLTLPAAFLLNFSMPSLGDAHDKARERGDVGSDK